MISERVLGPIGPGLCKIRVWTSENATPSRTLGKYPLEAEGPVDAIRVPQVNLGIPVLIEGEHNR
jgi:hypothetical protein